jgi:Na+:H+ antiporter, NhaA family
MANGHNMSLIRIGIKHPPEAILKSERSAALVLLAAAIFGLVLANSPVGQSLLDLKHSYVGIEAIGLKLSVSHWASDLLLAVFFLVAGLELKYELRVGSLSKLSSALVPVAGAIGGIAIPALIYWYFNRGTEYMDGWPIPTATDIAFALGVLAIFGSGLPKAARIFLLALAIFDDLVAISIIAIFYTENVKLEWLAVAAVIATVHAILERVSKLPINWIRFATFLLLWYAIYQSGVHATVAGVILGMIIPAKRTHSLIAKVQPFTNSVALPVFAFFAVAIVLPTFDGSFSSVFTGIAIALPVGKIVGITAFALIANQFVAKQDRLDLSPLDYIAVSGLAGVGFTVSLLMANLAFANNESALAEATLAVILGSLASMTIGAAIAQQRGSHYRRLRRTQ